MSIRFAVIVLVLILCTACDGDGYTSELPNTQASPEDPANAGASPLDSGDGFVFGVAQKYSNNPLGVVDVAHIAPGDTPSIKVLHDGSAYLPYRHTSGAVAVTQICLVNDSFGVIEYRQIAVLTTDGGKSTLTPCSDQIASPSGFTWIEAGQLSPDGQKLAAQLYSPGEIPISVVFERGQEIARYSGFGRPTWIDSDNLVLVGSKLVTARVGENTVLISDEVTEDLRLGRVAVSPDGSQLVFEWQYGVWIINVDGSGLRQVLPDYRYIYPTWSPDGQWIAAMQREAPTALDATLVGNGAVGGDYEYTNLQQLTLVNVKTGEQRLVDLSIYLQDDQMPQGGLSWY